jgi:hypothetical protein
MCICMSAIRQTWSQSPVPGVAAVSAPSMIAEENMSELSVMCISHVYNDELRPCIMSST